MPPDPHVLVEKKRGRARLILNRPDKHNAIDPRMHRELHRALWDADEDPAVHAIVIKGAGPSFCAGFDLSGYEARFDRGGEADARPDAGDTTAPARYGRHRDHFDDDAWEIERGQRLDLAPFDVHKPVIAQVHGHCLAGGTVIALFCDMLICADDARLGFPPSRDLGATPSMMWLYHVGPQWAKRLLLTGDTISGAEAAEIGLALKSVSAELLEAEVEQLLDRLAKIDPHLLSANKRIVNLGLELMGARTLQRLAAENDARAHRAPGTRAFFERVSRHGLREAFKRRDAELGDGRARVRGPEIRDERGRLIED